MSSIEVRGKIRNEYFEEWFYGDLLQDTEGKKYIITKDYTPKPNGIIELNTCQSLRVDPETVGRYTGVRDKYEVKIFEGDIISIKISNQTIKALIVYSDEHTAFVLRYTKTCQHEYCNLGDYEKKDIEIVGNFYDNKELLEELK